MRGTSVRQRAKERLKELSFPALKLSALIVKGKKIIVANTAFYPNMAIFRGFILGFIYIYTWFISFLNILPILCLILNSINRLELIVLHSAVLVKIKGRNP